MRSCGREAEGGGLLNRYTMSSRIEGSNPSGSATLYEKNNIISYLEKIRISTPKPTPKAQIAATKLAAISLSRDPAS